MSDVTLILRKTPGALNQFALDPQKVELVKLRCFAGLSFEQAAATLGIRKAPRNGGGLTRAHGRTGRCGHSEQVRKNL